MTKRAKLILFEIGFIFNLFCVGVCCIIIAVHWASQIEVEFAYLIKVLVPAVLDTITGGNPLAPIDFVNYLKFKLCQIL